MTPATDTVRVLVVEDDEASRLGLVAALEDAGMSVQQASTAEEAMASGLASVDVIVSDVMMPGQSGFELLSFVRERYPDLPVILVTAYATEHTEGEASRRGAFRLLRKPINLDELESTVRDASS